MIWFDELKKCLRAHYDAGFPEDTVGFLQGSADPHVWREIEKLKTGQMIVLGNRPPNRKEWDAAGVGYRNEVQEIKINDLNGFVIIYGGFIYRPWGHIVTSTPETLREAFPNGIKSWRTNYMAPK